ncbi:hypothetical protein [Vibrio phage BONAISHI]|nr:hypothetical protein [Vibrio phage BONAISHI]
MITAPTLAAAKLLSILTTDLIYVEENATYYKVTEALKAVRSSVPMSAAGYVLESTLPDMGSTSAILSGNLTYDETSRRYNVNDLPDIETLHDDDIALLQDYHVDNRNKEYTVLTGQVDFNTLLAEGDYIINTTLRTDSCPPLDTGVEQVHLVNKLADFEDGEWRTVIQTVYPLIADGKPVDQIPFIRTWQTAGDTDNFDMGTRWKHYGAEELLGVPEEQTRYSVKTTNQATWLSEDNWVDALIIPGVKRGWYMANCYIHGYSDSNSRAYLMSILTINNSTYIPDDDNTSFRFWDNCDSTLADSNSRYWCNHQFCMPIYIPSDNASVRVRTYSSKTFSSLAEQGHYGFMILEPLGWPPVKYI